MEIRGQDTEFSVIGDTKRTFAIPFGVDPSMKDQFDDVENQIDLPLSKRYGEAIPKILEEWEISYQPLMTTTSPISNEDREMNWRLQRRKAKRDYDPQTFMLPGQQQ
jgi:hypothetical protein